MHFCFMHFKAYLGQQVVVPILLGPGSSNVRLGQEKPTTRSRGRGARHAGAGLAFAWALRCVEASC